MSIGKMSVDDAIATISSRISSDNDMNARHKSSRYVSIPRILKALGIIDAETGTFSIVNQQGQQRAITPIAKAYKFSSPALRMYSGGVEPPLYLSRLDTPYWTTQLDDLKALYVQVNKVRDRGEEGFAAFSKRVQRESSKDNIRHLIVDFRHNGGGNGYLTRHLIRALTFFDASPNKGQLFIIIGRSTFSAAQNMITDLDRVTNAVFVGEPSGSRPNAIGERTSFTLPFSQVSGSFSSQLHQQSHPEDHRIWIAPDIPTGLTSVDFFRGHDPALDAISKVISAEKKSMQGDK
jgi:hypothetical protein